MVDVAQDAIIREEDCGTSDGIIIRAFQDDGNVIETLEERLVGRITQEEVIDPRTGEVLVGLGKRLTKEVLKDFGNGDKRG